MFQRTTPGVESLEDRWMPAVIAGIVYNDLNNNGIHDAGEGGLGHSTVQLRDSAGNLLASTVSDSTGHYQFTVRDSSTVLPATLTETANFNLAKTDQVRTAALALFDPSLGTLTSVDILASGSIQSAVQIENLGDAPGNFEADLSGQLSFQVAGGTALTSSPAGKLTATLGAFDGQADLQGNDARNFGVTNLPGTFAQQTISDPTTLSSFVGKGTLDVQESASATSSVSGTGNLLAMIRSMASGSVKVVFHYTPSNTLGPGQYKVIQVSQPPGGYTPGFATGNNLTPIPGTDVTHTIPVTIASNDDQSLNNNFAELQLSSLSGIVYIDEGNHGEYVPGDTLLSGVTIQLTGKDTYGHTVSRTTQTDGNGYYEFTNVVTGVYHIQEIQPTGYVQGTNTLGTLGGLIDGDTFTVALPPGKYGTQYNFGELVAPTPTPTPTPTPDQAPPPEQVPPFEPSKFYLIGQNWLGL
jgi:hypothetical protein